MGKAKPAAAAAAASGEGPRKARTAYIFFSSENFKTLAQSFSGADIYTELSRLWKAIDPAERARFDQLAADDRRRYERELELFRAGKFVPDPDQRPCKRKREGPGRALNAYQLFVSAKKKELRGTIPHNKILSEISTQWREITPAEKKHWQDEAALDKRRYVIELEQWQSKQHGAAAAGKAGKGKAAAAALEDEEDDEEDGEEAEEEEEEEADESEDEPPPKKKAGKSPKSPAPKPTPKPAPKPEPKSKKESAKAKPKPKAKPAAAADSDDSDESEGAGEADADGFWTEVIPSDSKKFWKVEDRFNGALQGTNPDYVKTRIMAGKKPVKFRLKEVTRIHNPPLQAAFAKKKAEFEAAGVEVRERVSFHSTHPRNVDSIVRSNLLPFGHPRNPCKEQSDSGWFGSNRKGVYVSKYAEYTFKYGNRMCPMDPGDLCSVVMFRTLPGKCRTIETLSVGLDPTPGYHSHASPNSIEWFVFDPDQLCPEYILKVVAFEDTRDVADDGVAS